MITKVITSNAYKVLKKIPFEAMAKAEVYVFENQFKGFPKKTDFKLVEETLPPLKDGEFLAEAKFLSVDPYMRSFAPTLKLGKAFVGEQVAKVTESKNSKFPIGSYVVGEFGWRTKTVATDTASKIGFPAPRIIPDWGKLPKSLALGVLGMPGFAAYFGLLEICKPKPGETLVVSGAAGAVGSVVGQIGKIKNCKVIGITGSDEKGKWLTQELGFDGFVNYKNDDFVKQFTDIIPNGVDCYFDNVGGEISSIVMNRMNKFGRVAVSGSISTYNAEPGQLPKASEIQTAVKTKHLHVEGLSVFKYKSKWDQALQEHVTWIEQGTLKYRETVFEGFDKMFDAFMSLFEGTNIGKVVVKV